MILDKIIKGLEKKEQICILGLSTNPEEFILNLLEVITELSRVVE